MKEIQRFLFLLSFMFGASVALAWGPNGHQTVGAIADKLLAGTHAGSEVKSLLAGGKLRRAALWADCAKGVVESSAVFRFVVSPRYPECKSIS